MTGGSAKDAECLSAPLFHSVVLKGQFALIKRNNFSITSNLYNRLTLGCIAHMDEKPELEEPPMSASIMISHLKATLDKEDWMKTVPTLFN